MIEVFFIIAIGLVVSYVIWKINKRKTTSFSEFLNTYGEMLAYAAIIIIGLTILLIKTMIR